MLNSADDAIHVAATPADADGPDTIAERDRTIEELRAGLEEARLTMLWLRTEIAARDRQIADLWEQAEGLTRTVATLSAERDALRIAAPRGETSTPGRSDRSLFGLPARWRRAALPEVRSSESGPKSAGTDEPTRQVA